MTTGHDHDAVAGDAALDGFVLFKPQKRGTAELVKADAVQDTPGSRDKCVVDRCIQPDETGDECVASGQKQSDPATHDETIKSAPTARSFTELGLDGWQVETLQGLGMVHPTPIQRACIPAIRRGSHVIGGARTGSGKTAAFALPILQALSAEMYGPFALVLTPTRELALQIAEQFQVLGRELRVTVSVVFGGMDMMRQACELARRPHIVVATPGRLVDLLRSSPDCLDFRSLRFCVIDEADRLLDPASTFQTLGEMPGILSHLSASCRFLLFSATLTDATHSFFARDGVTIANEASSPATHSSIPAIPVFRFQVEDDVRANPAITHSYLLVPSQVRDCYLLHLLTSGLKPGAPTIVFVGRCQTAEHLRLWLRVCGVEVAALHSQLSQANRIAALARFRSGQLPILVSTDVGSRGLDIPAVHAVINYDVPSDARDYVHRVGRTARAGRTGLALTLVTESDIELVERIEGHIGRALEPFAEPVENDVLALLNPVADAKRAAAMSMTDRNFGAARENNTTKWELARKRKLHESKRAKKAGGAE